jgi:predicted amidohydrolase YtcJ
MYAAVTRQTLDGLNPAGWVPEEKIAVEQALRAYTREAAFAQFAESDKGSIEPGKLADLVVLDKDLLAAVEPQDIRKVKVNWTIVGGQVVYQRK